MELTTTARYICFTTAWSHMARANISLDGVALKEVDDIIEASKPKYRNRSHFFQVAAEKLIAEEAEAKRETPLGFA